MSKIGRKPISTQDLTVTIADQTVSFKGAKKSGTYVLPDCLRAKLLDHKLQLELVDPKDKKNYNVFGLHRAMLANEFMGAREEFVQEINIVGLGFKGELKGDSIIFSLGYSHKIDFKIPKDVAVSIDKTGQKITLKSTSKFLVGDTAQRICALRRPEPYKGTGIIRQGEQIHRKTGKS